ncbi:MAG: glycosyl transferase, group 1 [Ilumatobacteraceae bacterium]|nr:glycosyl transferase, group 1 [Ilumatobacteraceae bacterium]
MRILHVVTWVAPGNPFGGPLRVACNDADELRRRGHHVEVIAAQPRRAARGEWRATDQGIHGFDSWRLLPGAGFSGVLSVGLLRFVRRRARSFDVVHVHLARDLVSLPAAAVVGRRGVPYVVQGHGMIDPSARRSARLLDRLLTARVLRDAASVVVLTDRERADVEAAFPDLPMHFETVPNGVPTAHAATARPAAVPEVLFCSRLHLRKRPVLFAEMAVTLLGDPDVTARFDMIGADEGELAPVRAVLQAAHRAADVTIDDAVEPGKVAERLAACDLLVLPSVDEPFPMVVLETLAAGQPVVISDSCGLAPFVTDNGCGLVVPGDDLAALITAVRSLITDPERRLAMGEAGRHAVEQHLGMGAVGAQLETHYAAAITARADRAHR